jgi:hypothetical protein
VTDCVLHIGTEKTGTSSIQATLAGNRERLLRDGVLWPRSLGEKIHARAYAYASEGAPDEIKLRCGVDGPKSLEIFRRDVARQFAEEVAATKPKTIIACNEHLSSRLQSTSEISRLRDLLSAHSQSIKVVVYLRAQGDAHRSAYSTYVKTGGTEAFHAPAPALLRDRYLYDRVLERWETVFGSDCMDVRIYDPSAFPKGDVLLDFADALDGRISLSDLVRGPHANIRLDSFSLAFLRAMNRYVPYRHGAEMNELRGNLHELVETFASGPPFEGDADIVGAIDAAVEESNEAVREKYFPNRPAPLFPSTAHNSTRILQRPEIDDEAARLMARLWEAKQRQVLQLKQRLERRGSAEPRPAP